MNNCLVLVICVLSLANSNLGVRLKSGPIEVCERELQLIADSGSCTRYHRCREMEALHEFTTDIAICSHNQVFDMVTSECVDAENLFLQDPKSCKTFYGCQPTKETSEGYIRSHYECPGDLRFHPYAKYCTFKTDVTDNLCNSRFPDQRIIGNFNLEDATNIGALPPSRRLIRPKQSDGNIRQGERQPPKLSSQIRNRFQSLPIGQLGKVQDHSENVNPKQESNLDRIASVISGQLLSLRNAEQAKNDKKE